MGTLLALVSASSYGLSDFVGGVASRRVGFVRVALLGHSAGLPSPSWPASWLPASCRIRPISGGERCPAWVPVSR